MTDLPSFLDIQTTQAHTHVRLNLWRVTLHISETDEDLAYYFATEAEAMFAVKWAFNARRESLHGRTDAFNTRSDENADCTIYKIWWDKLASNDGKDLWLNQHDRFYARPHIENFVVL